MTNSYNNIDQAYILPQMGIDPQYMALDLRKKELEESKQQRRFQQQQSNQWRNLGLIRDDLDFSKYQTGEQAIDNYAQGELKNISEEALRNHINDEPAQLEYWLQSQLAPLNKWHTMALGSYKNLDKTLQDYNKTYPNIDYGKARDLVLNKFQHDFLDVDEQGNITRKNTDNIKPSDYGALLQQPDVLGFINNDQSAFDKFFYDIPKTTVGGKDYTSKRGVVNSFGWSGMMPEGIGEVVTDEDNRPTSIRLRGEEVGGVTDAQGNPMRILPKDVSDRLKGNPAAYAAALGKWQQVKPAIEQNYMQRTGRGLTPDVEEMLRNSYLYNEANRLISHPVKTEEKQATPRYTSVTNVNLPKNTEINDVYNKVGAYLQQAKGQGAGLVPMTAIDGDARELLVKSVNAGRNTDNQIDINDMRLVLADNGDIRVVDMASDGNVVGTFTPTGINLKANTNAKQKQKILQGGTQPKANTAAPKQQTKKDDPLGLF